MPSICSLNGNTLTFTTTQTAGGAYSVSWGDNSNPNSFEPTSSFQVSTYTSGFGVEQHSGFISISMTTEASLLSSLISTSSYRNNDQISVTIDYTLPS